MADSFFGFDTSLSNLNDDEGGGEPSEDEYDALNDETFGQDSEDFDWEVEHEHLAEQLESSRRSNTAYDDVDTRLEASLCKLVLDETDAPQQRVIGSSVWRHDGIGLPTTVPTPIPPLKNVCTVEELERQLRQNQGQNQVQNQNQVPNQVQANFAMTYFQPRFPPVILQRPPGLQAPVPLPFAPQQPMTHNINQLNQPLNKIVGQNVHNQMGQPNQMMNHMPVNQLQQNVNQLQQNVNQLQQNVNQLPQNVNQLPQNVNQLQQNIQQLPQNIQQLPQNVNQLPQNMGQMNQNVNQLPQNMGQMNQNMGQMNQNMGQMNQNMGQMNQNVNQFVQNATQFHNNQIGQGLINQMPPNMTVHQMNQGNQLPNSMNPNVAQMGPNVNQNMNMNIAQQNMNQMGQSLNQIGANMNPMNQMGQNMSQMNQNMAPMGQNMNPMNQLNQNMNQMGQGMNQMNQNINQMGQMNQVGQNQMIPNGNQFGPGSQFPHMMGQPRMMGPPPGISLPRQNFNPNVNQFNPNFRGPSIQPKQNEPPMNQQMNPNLMKSQPVNHNAKPLNQSTPNKMIQKPTAIQMQNPQAQKVQKTRIYNNKNLTTQPNALPSTTQPLTSQSLVQIIQNTHPMLQFNNSFHNASHHPMLNRNNMFNQFNNMSMFGNMPNGNFGNANMHSNGDDSSVCSDADEYAGLMTAREKQWLVNIQMLQLNTGTPYIHDFYYTVFLERQASKEKEGIKEAHKANQQNHPFYSAVSKQESGRERRNSHRHNSTSEEPPRTYVPAQFENSLGKLQCGSVTAPRKIIDVEVVAGEPPSGRASRAPSVASTTNPAEVPREVKRTKQLLLDIEALYLILLRLEELNDPLAISNALILKEREEKQKQLEAAQKEAMENEQEEDSNLFLRNIESVQRRKQESPKSECVDKRQVVNLAVSQKPPPVKNLLDEDKDDLLNKMFLGLLHNDRLQQMLTVRKGRALIARFLSRAPTSHSRLRALWWRVLRALPAAARRSDCGLAPFAKHYRRYIQNTTGWSAVIESCGLLSEALDPARTPYVLTSCLTLSCVCALFERAVILVNTPDATSNERQWYKFLKTLARALKNTTLTVAKPVEPLSEEKLLQHIKQLESRSTIEILQRGKAAEFADLTKSDVSAQLVKHLC